MKISQKLTKFTSIPFITFLQVTTFKHFIEFLSLKHIFRYTKKMYILKTDICMHLLLK